MNGDWLYLLIPTLAMLYKVKEILLVDNSANIISTSGRFENKNFEF